jgi:FKBP-type peptidyl-prolyl cis-trans isomerase
MLKTLPLFFILLFLISCSNDVPVNYRKGTFQDKTNENLMRVNKYLSDKDKLEIEQYCKENNLHMELDPLGYYYSIKSDGKGELIKNNEHVEMSYKLSLLNGPICYSSDSTGNKYFIAGKAQVEAGLDIAIFKLRQGDEAEFIFPAFLAYGLIGDQNRIPARATIVYKVKIIRVLKE